MLAIGFIFIVSWLGVIQSQPVSNLIPVASVKPWATSSGQILNAVDNSLDTSWGSGTCRAGSWRAYPAINSMMNLCSTGACSASCAADLTSATDGSVYSAGTALLNQGEGRSWASFPLVDGGARTVKGIYIRGAWPVNTTLYATNSQGNKMFIASLGPELTHKDLSFQGPTVPITGLYVESATRDGVMRGFCYSGVGDCKSLTITEVAVQAVDCYEEVAVDLGSNFVLTSMKVKFNGFVGGMMATSLDDNTYVDRLDISTIPSSYFTQQTATLPQITARYVRIRYEFLSLSAFYFTGYSW